MHSTVFNTNSQSYPKINMTTKGPSQKHVLIPMNKDNKNTILYQANVHVRIINNHLKTCRSDTSIDCIQETWNSITITTSKVILASDLSIIEKYFKGLEDINTDENMTLCFLQSKSYLKILGVPYYGNNLSMPITNS